MMMVAVDVAVVVVVVVVLVVIVEVVVVMVFVMYFPSLTGKETHTRSQSFFRRYSTVVR